jgi:glycosyltransferase involved in cell wall biosynthesis
VILNYENFVLRIYMEFIPEIRVDFLGITFLVFCFAILIQVVYLFVFPLRLLRYKPSQKSTVYFPVSVIICARNEEDNLFQNLPKILEQDYPEFEVIVINDQSIDDSKHIIKAYQERYPSIKYIELEKNRHRKFGKKLPLTVGIKGALHKHLVFIDADCYPSSNQWLKKIITNYVESKTIVVGYGPYESESGFLNKMIRFDTTQIGITYLSFARVGLPYMAVGRNMSYTKDQFFEVEGFKKHYHIQSGDDDLFMRDAANSKNVAIEIEPESFVFSIPKKTWRSWFRQKQRHFSTASKYKLINKLFLGIFPASMVLMLLSFFILLFNYDWWLFISVLLGLRMVLYWVINGLLFKKLRSNDLIILYPFYELVHFLIMPFIYYSSERTEKSKW